MSESGSKAPPPTPPGKPSLEQIVTQMEAAISVGQLERARQQLTWAWQVYGAVPALQNLAARLLAPPEAPPQAAPPAAISPELPTLPLPAPTPPPPTTTLPPAAVSAELPTLAMPPAPQPAQPAQPPPAPQPAQQLAQPPRPLVSPDLPTQKMPALTLPPPAPIGAPPAAVPRVAAPLPAAPPPAPPAPAGPTPEQIEACVQQAQQLVRAADYDGALGLLARALQSAPQEETLQRHYQLIEKAAQRHRAAVERERAINQASKRIDALLLTLNLAEARQALREAQVEHGKHPSFDKLQEKLDASLAQQKKVEADELMGKAVRAMEGGDWQSALQAAEQCLVLAPGNIAALGVRQEAQAQLSHLGREKMQREAVEAVVRDVERLLGGRELQPATLRLTQAVQRLGRHPDFEELQKKIDLAKSEQQFQLRNDWAERRARELEALIQESVRASLANDFEKAVEKLEAAKKLEPEHPELEGKLEVAHGLLEKQRIEQRKAAELATAQEEIRSQLDALELDRAEYLLQRAASRFPEAGERFQPMRLRLSHLREAESVAIVPTPEILATLNRNTEAALADRQRALAAAYSWDQALLYPLRGAGPWLALLLTGALFFVDLVALYQPHLGPARTLLPLLFFFFTLPLLSATLEGGNQPRFADLKPSGRDLVVGFLGLLLPALLASPLLLFIAIRGNHHLLDETSGPLGFLALIALAYPIFPPLLPALGITAAFGPRYLLRFGRHFRFLASDEGKAWRVVAYAFLFFLLAFLARLALGPLLPWLGLPLAALLTAYSLIGLPHWIGIAVRRQQIELARLYS